MKHLSNIIRKFRFTESQFLKYKQTMMHKIPDINKAIELLEYLKSNNQKELETDFILTDGIYAKGKLNKGLNRVGLWLGADVMVEYSFEEAEKLLNKNLNNAENNIKDYDFDLSYIKDQITTVEVNLARIHNLKVKKTNEEKK